jgi:predicted nucleotidyltransferase
MILSTIVRTALPILAPLFRSEGQARLLAELFLSGDAELSISDLAGRAGLAYGSAHREVERLLVAGLLAERRVGNSRLIRPNPDSPLTTPVRDLLLVSGGPVPLLAAELSTIDGVETAFLFGSFAARMRGVPGDPPNDIDVMVVGAPNPKAVYAAARRVSDQVGRPVSPTIMSREELQADSGFLSHVKENPTVAIIPGDPPWQ